MTYLVLSPFALLGFAIAAGGGWRLNYGRRDDSPGRRRASVVVFLTGILQALVPTLGIVGAIAFEQAVVWGPFALMTFGLIGLLLARDLLGAEAGELRLFG